MGTISGSAQELLLSPHLGVTPGGDCENIGDAGIKLNSAVCKANEANDLPILAPQVSLKSALLQSETVAQ